MTPEERPEMTSGLIRGVHLCSMDAIKKGNYIIKASTTQFDSICFVIYDTELNTLNIRFFSDDADAFLFFNTLS